MATNLCAARPSEGKKGKHLEYWEEGVYWIRWHGVLHDGDYEHNIIELFQGRLAERNGMDSIIGPYSGIVGSGWRK